jgi:hypothetical protein
VGEVSQVVEGGDKLLQGFLDELGPFLHLSLEHYFQLVASVMILKCLGNFFIRRFGRPAMKNVGSWLSQGGDYVCGILSRLPVDPSNFGVGGGGCDMTTPVPVLLQEQRSTSVFDFL